MSALGGQLHPAPQYVRSTSLQLCFGPSPHQSQKEPKLKVGWITAGWGLGDTGNSPETQSHPLSSA